MPDSSTVKVLVVPLFKRYWLFHAWRTAAAASAAPKPWQEGGSLGEKAQLLLGALQRWGAKQGEQQWQKIVTAPEGTFNHKLHRLAREVLSRVDPNESFLKVLPQQASRLEFSYPASLQERLVRRRLRLLAAKAQPFHAGRLRVWSLALVPQIPLIPLPLPNVTIYFTLWRIISNRSAGKGAALLSETLDHLSDLQRLRLACQLVDLQKQQGFKLRPGTWATQLAAEADSLRAKVQRELGPSLTTDAFLRSSTVSSGKSRSSGSSSSSGSRGGAHEEQQLYSKALDDHQQHWQQQQRKGLPLPVFTPNTQLDDLVQPDNRLSSFLPEATAEKLAKLYEQPHFLEHYRAARKTCGEK